MTVKRWNSGNITCSSMLVMDRHYLFAFSNFCTQARGFIKDTIEHNDTTYYM